MEIFMEQIIKLVITPILIVAVLLVWLIPKTNFSRRIKMTEKVFIIMQVAGALCGIMGMTATILWPHLIVQTHLMWVILLPYALINFYYLMIMKIKKTIKIIDEKQDLVEKIELASDLEEVKKALQKIREEYREIIVLRFVEEMSVKETAEILGKSEGAVRVLLHRAVAALKEEATREILVQNYVR